MTPTYSVIDKNAVFYYITQEQVFERYLGEKVEMTRKYRSPLRQDKNPTCGFAYSRSGKLLFRDFSGHFWGDCIDLVQVMYGLNFDLAVEKIAADFNLLNKDLSKVPAVKENPEKQVLVKEKTVIEIQSQPFQNYDKYYWTRHGVSSRTLRNVFNTSSVRAIWINGNRTYTYHPKDPAIAYRLGKGEFKIYFPERRENRFICNTTRIQGWKQLPPAGDLVVITKSMKDVIVLYEFGIRAVAWQGEGIVPDQEKVEELKNRFKMVVSLYDFDLTGIRTANTLKRRDGIPAYFLTNGRFGTTRHNAKDFAEYVWNHGIPKSKTLVQTFKNRLKDEYRSRNSQLHNTRNAVQVA